MKSDRCRNALSSVGPPASLVWRRSPDVWDSARLARLATAPSTSVVVSTNFGVAVSY
jgi:hypothetical protein